MKKLLLFIIISGLTLSQMACEGIENSWRFWSSSPPQNIEIYMHNASVEVVGYSGNEIEIETIGGFSTEDDDRAEGLKSLSNHGIDNTGKGVSLKEDNGTVIISKVTRQAVSYRIKVPAKTKVILEETNWAGGGHYELSNLKNEVKVATKTSNMYFRNIEGTIKARGISGNAQLIFDEFKPGNYHDVSLISGEIDIILPKKAKANLKLKTITGEIYTDFEFPQQKNDDQTLHYLAGGSGPEFWKSLNGGGTPLRLKTISSNIYLRKKK